MEPGSRPDVPNLQEQLLANESFRRFSAGLELYQELFKEEADTSKQELIRMRMFVLHRPILDPEQEPEVQHLPLLQEIFRTMLTN